MNSLLESTEDRSSFVPPSSPPSPLPPEPLRTSATLATPEQRNAHMMQLLLNKVLPYSRLGVQQNQFVVSPPLALVAVAPEVRVYCEESAPYSLGGTWWLAHTATHCVVRCMEDEEGAATARGKRAACVGDRSTVSSGECAASCPDAVYTHRCRCSSGLGGAEGAVDESHGDGVDEAGDTEADDASRSRCWWWVPEEAYLAMQARRATAARDAADREVEGAIHTNNTDNINNSSSSSGSYSGSGVAPAESFMARHSGTMAQVPPQLSSNRRLLSFVRGVPPSFLGFCIHAAQHGWQSATRTLLEYLTHPTNEAEEKKESASDKKKTSSASLAGRTCTTDAGDLHDVRRSCVCGAPERVYTVHTQLYAICGYPESRIAHSMWWCLRRTASAMGPASLQLDTLSHTFPVVYHPSVLTEGVAGVGERGLPHTHDQNAISYYAARVADANGEASLLRYRSSQQMPSLHAALLHSREHGATRVPGLCGMPRSGHGGCAAEVRVSGESRLRAGQELAEAWVVTNACSLVVSGDITFWSGTFSVHSDRLLDRHWYPFFHRLRAARGVPDSAEEGGMRHRAPALNQAAEGDVATPAGEPVAPPPCALFVDGSVVSAVQHKLHRDAVRAHEVAAASATTIASAAATFPVAPLSHQVASTEPPTDRQSEADEEEMDVQPLFFDMVDDTLGITGESSEDSSISSISDDGFSSPRANTSLTAVDDSTAAAAAGAVGHAPKRRRSAAALWYNRREERLLDEVVHHLAFQLLHCVDVTYLRMPLGAELVAQRSTNECCTEKPPPPPSVSVSSSAASVAATVKSPSRCMAESGGNDRSGNGSHTAHDADRGDGEQDAALTQAEVWDARWLSCLFPRVQMLDLEGPPSVTRASSMFARGGGGGGGGGDSGSHSSAAIARGNGGGGGVVAPRQTRRLFRPRGLMVSGQTWVTPLSTMIGLEWLPELRHVVLRAYPFQLLPSVVPSVAGGGQRSSPQCASKTDSDGSGGCQELASSRTPRTMELSVMGWPHVSAAGLQYLVDPQRNVRWGVRAGTHTDALTEAVGQETASCRETASRSISSLASAAPRFVMLSFTHMDDAAFVEALEAAFHPPPSLPSTARDAHDQHHCLRIPDDDDKEDVEDDEFVSSMGRKAAPTTAAARLHTPSPLLCIRHITQLELSKTAVTTATLEKMQLPLHAPALQVLRLSSTAVDSVTPLAGMAHLRVLNLASTLVCRRGLRWVKWMPALEELFLTHCDYLCSPADPQPRRDTTSRTTCVRGIKGDEDDLGSAVAQGLYVSDRGECVMEEEDEEEDEERHYAPGEDIFSLCECAVMPHDCGAEKKGDREGGARRQARQPFMSLRMLDLSNNALLTERALQCSSARDGSTDTLCLEVQAVPVTQHGSESATMVRATDVVPMPRLETLFLMHTAVSRLDGLLLLCPNLRRLDVSFTPLREGGLWARVRCPESLPRLGQRDAGQVMQVRFPRPLRLHQLNLSGTPLASLYPLSCPPPPDWCYECLPHPSHVVGRHAGSVVGFSTGASEPLGPPLAHALQPRQHAARDGDTGAGRDDARAREGSTRAFHGPHKKIGDDDSDGDGGGGAPPHVAGCRGMAGGDSPTSPLLFCPQTEDAAALLLETHLRTLQTWLAHHRTPSQISSPPYRVHLESNTQGKTRCEGRRKRMEEKEEEEGVDGGTRGVAVRHRNVVHLTSAAGGRTIGVDAHHWNTALYKSRGQLIYGQSPGQGPFAMELQWTPPPRRINATAASPHDGSDAFVSAPSSSSPALSSARPEAAPPGHHACAGIVRYGVLCLSHLRQLHLGHSSITASGLAAGYGMPQHHMGEQAWPQGLVELSLRATPFLCPPYPPQALRGEVPEVVALHLHAAPLAAAAAAEVEGVRVVRPRLAVLPPQQRRAAAGTDHADAAGDNGAAAGVLLTERGWREGEDQVAVELATRRTGAVPHQAVQTSLLRPPAQPPLSAAAWSEAAALCAVLRLHHETLQRLDVSHTSVSLSTLFCCVYADTLRAAADGGKGGSAAEPDERAGHAWAGTEAEAGRPQDDGPRPARARDARRGAVGGATTAAASSPSLHWAIGSQWEDALAQGPMAEVTAALSTLLVDPSRVLGSRLDGDALSSTGVRGHGKGRGLDVRTRRPSDRHSSNHDNGQGEQRRGGEAATVGRHNTLALWPNHSAQSRAIGVGGVLGVDQLRTLVVEDTPLSVSLKRLFPRLYHCVRHAQTVMERACGGNAWRQAQDVTTASDTAAAEPSAEEGRDAEAADASGGEGSTAPQTPAQHKGEAREEAEAHEGEAGDSGSESEDSGGAARRRHVRYGPVRMREVWEAMLHALFGAGCTVQY